MYVCMYVCMSRYPKAAEAESLRQEWIAAGKGGLDQVLSSSSSSPSSSSSSAAAAVPAEEMMEEEEGVGV